MRREDLKTYSSLRDEIIRHNNYFTPLDTSMIYIDSIVNELKRKKNGLQKTSRKN